jgi:hypothetical protein
MAKKDLYKMLLDTTQFFNDFTNFNKDSKGFGLTSDSNINPKRASIAATGFMLCSLILRHHYHLLDKHSVLEIGHQTLDTLLEMKHFKGFLPHFLDRETGVRLEKTEYSTIDTMLALLGVLALDQFLDDPLFRDKTNQLFDRIDFEAFIKTYNHKKVFAMAYNNHPKGDYVTDQIGFIYQWHMYAEQLMMYLLYDSDDALELYDAIEKPIGQYKDIAYVYSPGNTLFIYQFPLAFIPLKGYIDLKGFSIYDNAVQAIKGHRALSIDLSETYKTFSKHAFGFNASHTKHGYRVFHAIPNETNKVITDGTVAPFGVVGSLPFLGDEILESIDYLKSIPNLYQKYGFMDAFHISDDSIWVSDMIISIDKGLEMLSFDAYLDHIIGDLIISHPRIIKGLHRLQFKKGSI